MNDTKEYLKQIRRCNIHIDNKLTDINNLRSIALKITASMKPDGGSGTGNQDKLGNIIAKIVDLENDLDREIDSYVDLKREIGAVVDRVKSESQIQVLHKRYFEFKTWERIACDMSMTCRNVWYIHGKALQSVEAILNERKQADEGGTSHD